MNEKQKLNIRLISIRKNKGLTQKKLSELADISEPTMNHYETGKRIPPVETLLTLARVLECDAGWLLTGQGSPQPQTGEPHEPTVADGAGFVFVPQYDIGIIEEKEPIQSSQIVNHLAFKRDWVLQELRTQPDQLLLIQCTGDAMEPTIRPDDLLLVDRSPEKKNQDGVFLLQIESGLYIRRVERRIDGGLIVRSDKPEAAPQEIIAREDENKLNRIGRVVWEGRRI